MYHDNHLYHVYNRGAHKKNIFRSDYQYAYCLNLIEKYKTKYSIQIYAYCLMPNHYHFLLSQNVDGSISKFLQTTFNAYVQAFNKMEDHSGTIFQGAARGILVGNDEYACQLIAYIHQNPVTANFVKNPELWQFSDYKEWIGKKTFRFEGKDLLNLHFEDSNGYSKFMKSYQEEKILSRINNYILD